MQGRAADEHQQRTEPAQKDLRHTDRAEQHHWARRLRSLGLDARLIAGHFVGPYRMQGARGKNDANDAAAICEAEPGHKAS